jgi:hypothetical protein
MTATSKWPFFEVTIVGILCYNQKGKKEEYCIIVEIKAVLISYLYVMKVFKLFGSGGLSATGL